MTRNLVSGIRTLDGLGTLLPRFVSLWIKAIDGCADPSQAIQDL